MLELYHAASSVCSIKVRLVLAEKALEWRGHLLNLSAGEQFRPDYLRLNPEAVVPTLVHAGRVILESSVIAEYLDRLSDTNPLMPRDIGAEFATRHWLIRCIAIHEAINSLSFATLMRQRERAAFSAAEIEARQNQIPNPQVRAKRRDLWQHGTGSVYAKGALHVLRRVFEDMAAALARDEWLAGPGFGLADAALLPYIDRLERLGMAGLWQSEFPAVGAWLAAVQRRPSYDVSVAAFVPAPEADAVRQIGAAHWPAIAALWN
ncbi:MAG: hypothetical protein CVV17_02555 [Gammaproteobacteria bacterium HGW-Gammaproteobacteria-7]|jgi:glutathione S-transferase|nr:MAG: hypothetical protein CVV17_02555 [Gammaproteobacteria bacterium HGW-Gammaproteobacteria-7]